MNKLLIFILISFLLNNCSLNKNSKLWNEKEKIENENKNLKKILVEKKNVVRELNVSLKLDLSKSQNNKKTNNKLNNFGSLEYEGNLNKISTHKFSKFENFAQSNFEPLFLDDGLIFFNKKGDIIRIDENKKISWKKNYYSKNEKRLNPTLSFSLINNNLIVII